MSDLDQPPSFDDRRRTGWAELDSGDTVELARSAARLGARILDIVIVWFMAAIVAVIWAISQIDEDIADDSDSAFGGLIVLLIGLLVGILYEVVQTAIWGQTLGKRMVGIKVINAASGGTPGWGKAIGRWAIPTIPILIPIVNFVGWIFTMLCYLSITWDRVHQGWHDKAAGTLVIRN